MLTGAALALAGFVGLHAAGAAPWQGRESASRGLPSPGSTLNAFDLFLVVFALTAIAREFGTSDASIAFAITVTLAFRPVRPRYRQARMAMGLS